MANELRDSLDRLLASLEAVGELEDAKKVRKWINDLDKPAPKAEEPEPAKRGPGRPRKEG